MDSPKKIKVTPLPLEKEFQVMSIRRRLGDLTREEVEEFLTEALALLAKQTHLLVELRDQLFELQGKNS